MLHHFKTFVYLAFSVTCSPPGSIVSCLPMSFFTSKLDIMNTPHQCSDSFFTLLATKPPVRTAVDVTPIIDLARRSQSPQLTFFDVPVSPRCWNASPPPNACRAEESPAPLKSTHNRLSTLVMLGPLPLQLFVFRSFFSSVFQCFFTLTQTHTSNEHSR